MPITKSALETMQVAMDLVSWLNEPTCIALIGNLGAGKTVFVKGIAKGLEINDVIQSPTFVIMRSYIGRMKLYHIDLYRIKTSDEAIPFEEYLISDGITAIEWAERIKDLLPLKRIEVRIDIIGREERRVTINDYRN
ncbi:tRNA (adenosine(37)-N6)-threonylcarbamoyltransferase complex ATPase subunit type 1 TsaE [candidate division WOR-3 bacterium]|nr:tRNA (adenosine(37)-N6)-threonylcarbamoyltransferase complex ATPase subunit type 1 TsaE [candidate division WOR-3 bacterium]